MCHSLTGQSSIGVSLASVSSSAPFHLLEPFDPSLFVVAAIAFFGQLADPFVPLAHWMLEEADLLAFFRPAHIASAELAKIGSTGVGAHKLDNEYGYNFDDGAKDDDG